MKHVKDQQGFTIVELLISTTVFSVILLLCLAALVQIGKMYYKGVTTAQTQQTARAIMDEITQGIQLSGDGVRAQTLTVGPQVAPADPAVGFFCIGSTRYTYAIDRQVSDANNTNDKQLLHALWVDEPGACAGATDQKLSELPTVDLSLPVPSTAPHGRELLSSNMRITRLTLVPTDGDRLWTINLTIAYGDEDLFTTDPADSTRKICKGAQAGTQFCAFSEITSVIKRRLSI